MNRLHRWLDRLYADQHQPLHYTTYLHGQVIDSGTIPRR